MGWIEPKNLNVGAPAINAPEPEALVRAVMKSRVGR
jgi:hypothetical protein